MSSSAINDIADRVAGMQLATNLIAQLVGGIVVGVVVVNIARL